MRALLLLAGLLLCGAPGRAQDSEQEVSPKELKEMSAQGSKYINKELKHALKGMRQIKALIEKNNEERKALLDDLEEAKMKKEGALNATRESEEKLKESQSVCNESMQALWEECKPCLKQTCMKFYARVCRRGTGVVSHQLEEFLNQSSPLYLWMNGDRIDSLLEDDRQQAHELDAIQDSFQHTSSLMDTLFADSFFDRDVPEPHFWWPSLRGPAHRGPLFFGGNSRVVRSLLPFHRFEPFNFEDMFRPMMDMMQRVQAAMEAQLHEAQDFPPLGQAPGEFPEGGDNRTVCKEIRHNSTGCLKMKNQCAKCREILAVDCSASNPAQERLRQDLSAALLSAEKFSRRYEQLLRSYQQKTRASSGLLKQLNEEFSWISRLANQTQGEEQDHLQVTTVSSQSSSTDGLQGVTLVGLKLFDAPPMTVSIPDTVSRESPRFMEMVAEKALRQYRQQGAE
ncbi:clusterin [Sorex araneus]|uniref:clusterin n=1 Tax=Sorex araneus TaxID=42254 RepID=UPI0024334508|nr:clusterin [Sorex araneus]XP_054978328.1 clusterin [Sorex araneus]